MMPKPIYYVFVQMMLCFAQHLMLGAPLLLYKECPHPLVRGKPKQTILVHFMKLWSIKTLGNAFSVSFLNYL